MLRRSLGTYGSLVSSEGRDALASSRAPTSGRAACADDAALRAERLSVSYRRASASRPKTGTSSPTASSLLLCFDERETTVATRCDIPLDTREDDLNRRTMTSTRSTALSQGAWTATGCFSLCPSPARRNA